MMRWAISLAASADGTLPQDDGEFIAAEPRHRVAVLDAGAQPLRHDGQQLIAGDVADRYR